MPSLSTLDYSQAHDSLRWYFQEGAEAAMGFGSNFNAILTHILRGGARSEGTPNAEFPDEWIDAISRAKRIRRILATLSREHQVILHAAFSVIHEVKPFGDATGLIPFTYEAQKAWEESETDQSIEEWCYRLANRVLTNSRDGSAKDRIVLRSIQREANGTLRGATNAFESTMRRLNVHLC